MAATPRTRELSLVRRKTPREETSAGVARRLRGDAVKKPPDAGLRLDPGATAKLSLNRVLALDELSDKP